MSGNEGHQIDEGTNVRQFDQIKGTLKDEMASYHLYCAAVKKEQKGYEIKVEGLTGLRGETEKLAKFLQPSADFITACG